VQLKGFFTIPALLALAVGVVSAAGADGGLRVGAARIDVTGPRGPSQTGKYDHEKVYVRAIVLDNGVARAALVSVESGQFDWTATLKGVATELDCPVENVIISGTHTHSGSATQAPRPGGTPPPAVASPPILEAVRQARGALQPARVGFGTGTVYLNVNRDAIHPETRKWTQYSNPDAPSDKTVAVLAFFKPTGQPIAVYVNYAMHPIDGYVLGIVSGDFPGAMSRYVEKAFGEGPVVAFSQGSSGDQNPLYLRPSNNAMASRAGNEITGFEINREASEGPLRDAAYKGPAARDADPKVIDGLFRFIESEGQILGEEVIRVMTWTQRTTSDVRILGLRKVVSCPARKRTNGDPLDPRTREGVEGTYEDAPPVGLQIGVLGIGTVALASVNGEIYARIGLRAKDESPLKNTVLVTSANGRIGGYLPDDASYGHQTFQVLNTVVKPGCAETAIVNTIADLETQYLGGQ
jgi:neutral ceramidase